MNIDLKFNLHRTSYRGLLMQRIRASAYKQVFSKFVDGGARTVKDIVDNLLSEWYVPSAVVI